MYFSTTLCVVVDILTSRSLHVDNFCGNAKPSTGDKGKGTHIDATYSMSLHSTRRKVNSDS